MADRTFRLVHPLPVSATRAFDWHTLPGAFERLVPPWEDVRMEGPPAPVEEGAEQVVSFPLGPLRGRWRSRISSVVPGESFQDVQVSGPFARWTHTHKLRDLEGGTSELEDSVAYALPLGPLGALFGGGMVKGKLERMFAYRHRITRGDLERSLRVPHPTDPGFGRGLWHVERARVQLGLGDQRAARDEATIALVIAGIGGFSDLMLYARVIVEGLGDADEARFRTLRQRAAASPWVDLALACMDVQARRDPNQDRGRQTWRTLAARARELGYQADAEDAEAWLGAR